MQQLTISEIKNLKKEYEGKIASIIIDFQNKTGVGVRDIKIEKREILVAESEFPISLTTKVYFSIII